VAKLQHPNIVAIHEVGEADGQHYFSMDYVEGRNLADMLRQGPMVARQAALYLRTIAEAVQHAHQHGIIHRDLKPSNVLIDGNNQPRITDFGLAKRLPEKSETGKQKAEIDLTLSGQVVGSPNYLPPEQAGGTHGAVGPASDVYSLGAILYHLLTGRPPFQAESLTTLIRQVLESDPVALRLLNPSIPRDLETICLKCLEKEMPRRYASAQGLADELGRFLEDKPIQARPVRVPEKVWRWGWRNPRLAGLGAACVFLLLAVAIGSPIAAYRINRERHRAEAEKLFARQNAYAADMSLALQQVNSSSLGRAENLLATYLPQPGELDLRRWEWRLLWKLCRSDAWFTLSRERADLATLAVSPNGQTLAVRELSGLVSLWNISTRKKTAVLPGGSYLRSLAFSPRSDLLASGNWYTADPSGGARLEPGVTLWDVARTKVLTHLRHPDRVCASVFSPDGTRLVTLGVDQGVRLWNVQNLPEASVITNFPCLPISGWNRGAVVFSPDGATLAIGETDGRIRLIDLATYQETTNFVAGVGILALAFSPDGRTLASGSGYIGRAIRLWDGSTGQPLGALEGHGAYVSSVAFHPRDSKILASAGGDQTVRLWDLSSRSPLAVLQGHVNEVRTVAFLPDGQALVSCDRNGDVCFWKVAAKTVSKAYLTLPAQARMVAFFPDSRSFATAEGPVILWDSAGLKERERLPALGTNNLGVVLSPDGRLLIAGDSAGRLKAWDTFQRREVTNLAVGTWPVMPRRFIAGGRYVYAGVDNLVDWHKGMVFDVATWRNITPWHLTNYVWAADWSPDGRVLVTGTGGGNIRFQEMPGGRVVKSFPNLQFGLKRVAFSPDGRFVLTGGEVSPRMWDVATVTEIPFLQGHLLPGISIAFSPDGQRLAFGGGGGVSVWLLDVVTRREVGILGTDSDVIMFLAFSPDGNILVAISDTGTAHFWHAPTFAEIEAAEKENANP
jgi:eukaryotic-like serine/threonine-protein kinase